jgi:protein gp37
MSDLFHEKITFGEISKIIEVMEKCPQHTFQILTKRPEQALVYFGLFPKDYSLPDNVWLGVSCENQETADLRIPTLLHLPAKVRFISAEPLLEEIENVYTSEIVSRNVCFVQKGEKPISIEPSPNKLDWVIVGCESGAKKRICELKWVESIVEQCKTNNVPVFVKQLQYYKYSCVMFDKGLKPNAILVEKDITNFPKHLRIREFPKGVSK